MAHSQLLALELRECGCLCLHFHPEGEIHMGTEQNRKPVKNRVRKGQRGERMEEPRP